MRYFRPAQGFNSMEEFENYLHCVRKAKVGDEVEVYLERVRQNSYAPSQIPTDNTEIVKIIGMDQRKTFLLGSNRFNIGFWSKGTSEPKGALGLIDYCSDINEYRYAYWVRLDVAIGAATEPQSLEVRLKALIKR